MTIENVVYTKDGCKYCSDAKNFLLNLGIPFTEEKLSTEEDKKKLLEVIPSARTMPQIILNGVVVGGFTDLKELHTSGRLFKNVYGNTIIQ